MGRVPNTGQGKAFEGDPSSIHDKKSIQKAIKGTIATEADATKNMATLAGLARQDMFYPKRDSSPVDMVQFRNYPLPTISINDIVTSKTGVSGDWDVEVDFNVTINHYVGFNSQIEMSCTVNLDASSEQTQTRYIAAKETNLRNISYAGGITNTFSFSFIGAGNSTGGGEDVDVTIQGLFISDDADIGNALSPAGGGSAYYNPSNLITVQVGTVQNDNPFAWDAIEIDSTNNCTFDTIGATFAAYTRQATLSIGMKIYSAATGETTITPTEVRMYQSGETAYICQLNLNKEITSIIECDSGFGA